MWKQFACTPGFLAPLTRGAFFCQLLCIIDGTGWYLAEDPSDVAGLVSRRFQCAPRNHLCKTSARELDEASRPRI